MPNTYHEHLITRAQSHWAVGHRLPVDLFAEMLSAGLDVEELERRNLNADL
jgi:hypothetical protein